MVNEGGKAVSALIFYCGMREKSGEGTGVGTSCEDAGRECRKDARVSCLLGEDLRGGAVNRSELGFALLVVGKIAKKIEYCHIESSEYFFEFIYAGVNFACFDFSKIRSLYPNHERQRGER